MMTPKITLFGNFSLLGGSKEKKESSCKKEHSIFDLTRDIVCYNQGKIAEYYFLHDKYQTELLQIMNQILSQKNDSLLAILIETYEKYNTHLGEELNNIVQNNLGFTDSYFLNRKETRVRSCIKILDKNLNVIDPFRQNEKIYKYNKNTGFQRLIDHNKAKHHYLCQNIPEFAAKGNYINTRIDIDCMKKYYELQKPKNKIAEKIKNFIYTEDKNRIENEWIKCWKGYNRSKVNFEDCYKSTLIIPMTFKNNSLSSEFISYLNSCENKKEINTLGFLCFDHIEIDYFIEEMDINFCYKIADLVSLFLLKDFTSKNNKEYLLIERFVEYIKENEGKNKLELIENFTNRKVLK